MDITPEEAQTIAEALDEGFRRAHTLADAVVRQSGQPGLTVNQRKNIGQAVAGYRDQAERFAALLESKFAEYL